MRSKYQVNADIRRVFVRHWIDPDGINCSCHRDSVRVTGEIHSASKEHDVLINGALFDTLQTEIGRLGGVRRVHFDFNNWRRSMSGQWVCTEKDPQKLRTGTSPTLDTDPTTMIFRPRKGDEPEEI